MFYFTNKILGKEFDVLKPRKNKKGDRLFTQEDIKNLHIIFHLLKERGFTIEGAKKKLKENKNDTINQFEIVQSLNKLKSFLIEIKEDIN